MTIMIIKGELYCSFCKRKLKSSDIYKINEFSYQLCCSDCEDKHNFSKGLFVNCNTKRKEELFDLIYQNIKEKKTIILDNQMERKSLPNATPSAD